jgi:hypothetical protein
VTLDRTRRLMRAVLVTLMVAVAMTGGTALAQEERVTPEQIAAAIDQLGNLDYAIRARAAQTIRRSDPAMAVAALMQAVDEHKDGYVRFRALVLLSGFNDPRTRDVMARAIADPNDRLREVGFAWFEAHPEPSLAREFVKRLDTELADFVRPALIRALAALGRDPVVQRALVKEAYRGQDFFRSAVVEALGDYKGTYAFQALSDIAKQDGPLRDDAVLALGRIGDVRAVETFSALQRSGGKDEQPLIAAAICLTGRNCDSHRGYLMRTLGFSGKEIGFQELLRGTATGLGALAERGDQAALQALFDAGVPAQDPQRAPIALAVGRVALRNPTFMLDALSRMADLDAAVLLLRDAFDMLEEDFEEERFFSLVRRGYWQATADSSTRKIANKLITVLDF